MVLRYTTTGMKLLMATWTHLLMRKISKEGKLKRNQRERWQSVGGSGGKNDTKAENENKMK